MTIAALAKSDFFVSRRRVKPVCYLVNIAQPFTDVLEALGVGDVIDQHDAHGSSVVGGGDRVEPFLARCVPAEAHSYAVTLAFRRLYVQIKQ